MIMFITNTKLYSIKKFIESKIALTFYCYLNSITVLAVVFSSFCSTLVCSSIRDAHRLDCFSCITRGFSVWVFSPVNCPSSWLSHITAQSNCVSSEHWTLRIYSQSQLRFICKWQWCSVEFTYSCYWSFCLHFSRVYFFLFVFIYFVLHRKLLFIFISRRKSQLTRLQIRSQVLVLSLCHCCL